MQKVNKSIEKKKLLQKMMNYCAYQERSENDVIKKLKKYQLNNQEIIEILKTLKKENFINNQRFLSMYVRGKFRNNRWGRNRIRFELKRKGFVEEDIVKGLEGIDAEEYEKKILQLIHQKESSIKNPDMYIRQNRIVQYLCSKGFENDIVWDFVKKVIH